METFLHRMTEHIFYNKFVKLDHFRFSTPKAQINYNMAAN